MSRKDYSRAAVHSGKLLYGDCIAKGVKACTAIFLFIRNTHVSHLAQLLNGLMRKFVFLIHHKSNGLYFRFSKLSDYGTQGFMLL